MKPILEYIISKNNSTKFIKPDKIIFAMFRLMFTDDIHNVKNLAEDISEYCKDQNFHLIRMYWSGFDKDIDTESDDFKIISPFLFKNLLDSDFCDDIVESISKSSSKLIKHKQYEDYSDRFESIQLSITVSYFDSCIFLYEANKDWTLVIENIESPESVNPKIETYYFEHKKYLEFSKRKLYIEMDQFPEDDLLYNALEVLIKNKINQFEKDFGLEIKRGGNGARHVLLEPTYEAIHRYEYFKREINKIQDWLVDEFNKKAKEWENRDDEDF